MGQHYVRRFDLSKYTLKSFDGSDEFCADMNNSDQITVNANGTTMVLGNSIATGQSVPTPFVETASAANGGTIPGVQGGPITAVTLIKNTTAIADATATTIYTVTVPNAAHAATIGVTLTASLGAGGAVGAFEETLTAFGQIVLTRTPGLACVASATSLTNTGKVNVAGADSTATLAYSVTSMSGANSATQTFNIQVTITKGGGASANHSCMAEAVLYNVNTSGVTIA